MIFFFWNYRPVEAAVEKSASEKEPETRISKSIEEMEEVYDYEHDDTKEVIVEWLIALVNQVFSSSIYLVILQEGELSANESISPSNFLSN